MFASLIQLLNNRFNAEGYFINVLSHKNIFIEILK